MKSEIRSNREAVIEGYVNVCGRESRAMPSPRGKFIEIVKPGTFQQALNKGTPVGLMFNHSRTLGGTDKGNLELREDNIGLYAKATISDADVITKAKEKRLHGWSFGFVCAKDSWKTTENGECRTLEDIELREVSILDITPAYIATSIEMRDGAATICEHRVFDEDIQYINADKAHDNAEKCDFSVKMRFLKQKFEFLKRKGGF